jgi:hypothetical protein
MNVPSEIKNIIVQLWSAGKTTPQISLEINQPINRVKRVVNKSGIRKHNKKFIPTDKMKSEILELRNLGIPIKDIANKLNLPVRATRHVLEKTHTIIDPLIRAKNNYEARIKKNPDHMKYMTSFITNESNDKRSRTMKERYKANHDELVKRIQIGIQAFYKNAGIKRGGPYGTNNATAQKRLLELNKIFGVNSFDEYMVLLAKDNDGKYLGPTYISAKTKVEWECNKGHHFFSTPNTISNGCWCPKCLHTISVAQQEIFDFVASLVGVENVIMGDRKILEGKEIDIYIPSKNLGIEFNGLIWHSYKFSMKKKNFARNKTINCLAKGIKLLTIFEDEWGTLNKKLVWQNIIKKELGVLNFDASVNFNIKKIDFNDDVIDFLDKYDLGIDIVTNGIAYGGYINERLVVCCIIGIEANGECTILKFGTNHEYNVDNLRLINYICDDIRGMVNKLYYFSDNRFGINTPFPGFDAIVGEDVPMIFYTDGISRFIDDDNSRPLYKIEDCGHRKWVRLINE